MIPFQQNITVRLGDVKEIFIRLQERVWDTATSKFIPGDYIDLTGYNFLSQIRETADSANVLLTFTVTVGNQADPVSGKGSLILKLTGIETAGISRALAAGEWDLQVTDTDGNPNTYVAGTVTFVKDVSRV